MLVLHFKAYKWGSLPDHYNQANIKNVELQFSSTRIKLCRNTQWIMAASTHQRKSPLKITFLCMWSYQQHKSWNVLPTYSKHLDLARLQHSYYALPHHVDYSCIVANLGLKTWKPHTNTIQELRVNGSCLLRCSATRVQKRMKRKYRKKVRVKQSELHWGRLSQTQTAWTLMVCLNLEVGGGVLECAMFPLCVCVPVKPGEKRGVGD